MTVTAPKDGVIHLRGICSVEDAEVLLRFLTEAPHAAIDWSECSRAHTAVVQVLMAAGRSIVGMPTDVFLRDHVAAQISKV